MSAAQLLRCTIITLCLAAACNPATAATFCVSSPAQLVLALASAGSNGSSNTIRVSTGPYIDYSGVGFAVTLAGGNSLTIDGGWASFFDQPCALRYDDPGLTTLDGYGSTTALTITHNGTGNVTVRNLTFAHGSKNAGNGSGLTLDAAQSQGITIERNVFRNNSAHIGALLVITQTAAVVVRSNLFRNNHALSQAAAAFLQSSAPVAAVVANNTFVDNKIASGTAGHSRVIVVSGSADFILVNNLSWNNSGTRDDQPDVNARAPDLLLHNNIERLGGTLGAASRGNRALVPLFVAADDFRLQPGSPLRNAGFEAGAELLGNLDLDGNVRRQGRAPDIGAWELPDAFASGFE
jgi:hypothetical protein